MTYIPYKKNLSIADEYDILVDKYGDAGTTRFGISGTYNVALAKICVKNQKYKEYIRAYLSSKPIYEYLHNACIASTRASLNESTLSFLKVIVPDEEISMLFEEKVHILIEKIIKNNNENKFLAKIRDDVAKLLLNGQIKIR